LAAEQLLSDETDFAELELSPQSSLPGQTPEQIRFRRRFGVGVLCTNLEKLPLQRDDVLLIQGTREQLDALQAESEFHLSGVEATEEYQLEEQPAAMCVPEDSHQVASRSSRAAWAPPLGWG
jgi:hypothetical protein